MSDSETETDLNFDPDLADFQKAEQAKQKSREEKDKKRKAFYEDQIKSKLRNLGEEEMNYILDSIPSVSSKFRNETVRSVDEAIRKFTGDWLKKVKIVNLRPSSGDSRPDPDNPTKIVWTPSNPAVIELRAQLVFHFENALITMNVYEPVGVGSAEALGGPITQMALNSFHAAGARKKIASGVDRIRELIYLSKKTKYGACRVYFKHNIETAINEEGDVYVGEDGNEMTFDNAVSFEDVIFQKQADLVRVDLANIVSDFEWDDISNIVKEEDEWWYELFALSGIHSHMPPGSPGGPTGSTSPTIVRLHLKVEEMYAHRITMNDICMALSETVMNEKEVQKGGRGGKKVQPKKIDKCITCVYSPQSLGIVDLYPNEDVIKQEEKFSQAHIPSEMVGPLFLKRVVLGLLDRIKIKGINGITAIYPHEEKVLSIVSSNATNIKDEGNGVWKMRYEQKKIAMSALRPLHFENLIRSIPQIEILPLLDPEEEGQYIRIRLPPDAVKENPKIKAAKEKGKVATLEPDEKEKIPMNPYEYIGEQIKKDEDDEEEFITEYKKMYPDDPYPRRRPTLISLASKYISVDTDGTNLRELLMRDDIDGTCTISNNVHEILRIFGIEAARNFLIYEFIKTFQESHAPQINVRHIELLVDYMTNRGRFSQITFTGMTQMEAGPFAESSLQQGQMRFYTAGMVGQVDPMKSTSANVYVGQIIESGAGAVKLRHDEEQERVFMEQLRVSRVARGGGGVRVGAVGGLEGIPEEIGFGFDQSESLHKFGDIFAQLDPNEFAIAVSSIDAAPIGLSTRQMNLLDLFKDMTGSVFESEPQRPPETVVTFGSHMPDSPIAPSISTKPNIVPNQVYPILNTVENSLCVRPAETGPDTSLVPEEDTRVIVPKDVASIDTDNFLTFMANEREEEEPEPEQE